MPLCAADLSSTTTTTGTSKDYVLIHLQMAIVEWQIEPINLPSGSVALAVIKHGQNGVRREALIIE